MEILKNLTLDQALLLGLVEQQIAMTLTGESFTGGQVNLEEWTQVASVVDPVEFDLYMNSIKVNTTPVTLSATFIDLDTKDHVIGKYYTGFIYRICIY